MDIEVHQVPGESKPNQCQTSKRQNNVVQLRPDPASRIAQAADRVQPDESGTDGADHAQDSKPDNPGRQPVNPVWIVGQRKYENPSDVEHEEKNRDNARQKPQPAVRRSIVKLFAVVLPDNGRHGPQQYGEPQNTKSKNQQTDIEELIFEQTNFLKNKERIIQL